MLEALIAELTQSCELFKFCTPEAHCASHLGDAFHEEAEVGGR